MAQLLDAESIEAALVALPGWQRVENTLVKDVPVDGAAADNLEAAVARVAEELDHHPVIERAEGRLRLTVWTHSAGGVTSKDVVLAGRIDEAISGTG
jgi:4a-hydroxytetrahydrobiopterin dehydratase